MLQKISIGLEISEIEGRLSRRSLTAASSMIRTEQDYKDALNYVCALFDNSPEPDTPEGKRFDATITLIEAYESNHFPIDNYEPGKKPAER